MSELERQKSALKVLRAFNAAITANRLYPPMAPQVITAQERSKAVIDDYLVSRKTFHIGLIDGHPAVEGEVIDHDTRSLLSDVGVFKQLELLEINHLVFFSPLPLVTFKQLVGVFSSRKEKINREGGGRAFVTNLELGLFFPEFYEHDETLEEGAIDVLNGKAPINLSDLIEIKSDELQLAMSLKTQEFSTGLKANFAKREFAISFFYHAIGESLLRKDENSFFYLPFTAILKKIDAILTSQIRKELVLHAARYLPERISDKVFTFLLVQDYPDGLGQQVFEAVLSAINLEQFKKSLIALREKEAWLIKHDQEKSKEIERVRSTHGELLATSLGRQLLGVENAKESLRKAEKSRKSQRLESGLNAISQGSQTPFQNDEIVFSLPQEMGRMLENGETEEVKSIITHIVAAYNAGDVQIRLRLSQCLTVIGEVVLKHDDLSVLDCFTSLALKMLMQAETGDYILEKTAEHLQNSSDRYLQADQLEKAGDILSLFMKIRTGEIKKTPPVRALLGRVQDRLVSQRVMAHLLQAFIDDKENLSCGNLIIQHGPLGIAFLIEALIASNETEDRLRLLELLLSVGPLLPSVVIKSLANPMPWYGKRNLLKLLGDTGSEEHARHGLDFLRHADLRVQREAFLCLYKIGGKRRKELFLKGATIASDAMLPQLIKAMASYIEDENVVDGLLQILLRYRSFSDGFRQKIIQQILQILQLKPSQKVRDMLLEAVDKEKGAVETILSPETLTSMLELANQIKTSGVANVKPVSVRPVEKENVTISDTGNKEHLETNTTQQTTSITFLPEELKIREMLQKGDLANGKVGLIELITLVARKRKFDQAEALREWLIELDPMSLTEIIRTAEVIEEEKSLAIDKSHIEVWSDLYELLTTDEFSTLYHSMQHRRYGSDENVVKQGAMMSALFFINSGNVKLHYKDGESEVLIKTAGEGEILGVESFFDSSVWTIGASTMGRADIAMLRLDRLKKWNEDYPALESKLNDYCLKYSSMHEYLEVSRKDRRQHGRTQIQGRVASVFLDKKGNATKVGSKGELADVSAGGVSFFIRISKKDNARILLGRKIRMQLPAIESRGKLIQVDGTILAVKAHLAMENEYSIHVKLRKDMTKNELQKIVRASKEN